MSRLTDLRSATSRRDVALLLQTSLRGLAFILHSKDIASRYTTFEIPKRDGTLRIIKAPDDKLKLLQRKLSVLLQDCLEEIEAGKPNTERVVHGFKRHRSIFSNAEQHRHHRWVLNLDLKDFFASINFGRVRGFFIKDRDFALNPNVATILAQIACDGQALPQGSPCSPIISNLVARILDVHLIRLSAKCGCTYTRYADDLTFSSNKKTFPSQLACKKDNSPSGWSIGPELQEIIDHCGFLVNDKKTRMQYRDSRQDVTGLVVNERVNVRKEYRQEVRAMVHRLITTGKFDLRGKVIREGKFVLEKREGRLEELQGRLNFVYGIDRQSELIVARSGRPKNVKAIEFIHRQFLLYRDFHSANQPVILCEGKTDNTYLSCAIRRLADQFPLLVESDDNKEFQLKIKLYKYVSSRTAHVLGLGDGGAGVLGNFIRDYKKCSDKFVAPGLRNPVIVLFDDDSGAGSIINAVKYALGHKGRLATVEPFLHVTKNLYVLPVPRKAVDQPVSIEDLFDAQALAMKIGDKVFCREEKFDDKLFLVNRYLLERLF